MKAKIFSLLFSILISGCSVAPSKPLDLDPHAKIGILNQVNNYAHFHERGFTALGNSDYTVPVDWKLPQYINNRVTKTITDRSNYDVVQINDPQYRNSFKVLLNSFSQFTDESNETLHKLRAQYNVDILLLIKESQDYVNDNLYPQGYGAHKIGPDTYVHTNLMIYAIDLRTSNLFFPGSLNGFATKPFKKKSSWSGDNLFESSGDKKIASENLKEIIFWRTD